VVKMIEIVLHLMQKEGYSFSHAVAVIKKELGGKL